MFENIEKVKEDVDIETLYKELKLLKSFKQNNSIKYKIVKIQKIIL